MGGAQSIGKGVCHAQRRDRIGDVRRRRSADSKCLWIFIQRRWRTNNGGSGSGGGNSNITAACKLTDPPKSAAKLPSSTGTPLKASGKVGVILPDTTSSTRYTLYDKPLLQSALTAAGITPDIQNAGGSTARYQQIAQSMIGEGVKVLIMDSIDATSGAAVEKQASDAGIKVIDYDRVNLGGTAQYYVSFDNEDVGKLQGQTLVDCLNASKANDPQIIEMAGGKDVDNNAILFAKGANSVHRPAERLRQAEEGFGVGRQGLGRQQRGPDLHPGPHRQWRKGQRGACGQRRHR